MTRALERGPGSLEPDAHAAEQRVERGSVTELGIGGVAQGLGANGGGYAALAKVVSDLQLA